MSGAIDLTCSQNPFLHFFVEVPTPPPEAQVFWGLCIISQYWVVVVEVDKLEWSRHGLNQLKQEHTDNP